MARLVRDARIETREARRRLAAQSEPHWRAIVQGAHVGYYKGVRKGAWLVRWRTPTGGYQKATLGQADDVRDADGVNILDFRQAQTKALEQITVWERGAPDPAEPDPAGPYTVADAIADYLAWTSKHRRPTTAREWTYMANAHILPALGKMEVCKLTTARLRRWHEGLADRPARLRTRPGDKQRYREAPADADALRSRRATANRVLTVLKASLNKAFHDGKAASDAAWRPVKPFRGADTARVRYLSEDECRRLLNACPEDFHRIVRGAVLTGCRYGELCRAEVRDFNPEAGTLLVRESKAGKPRHIPLDDGAVAFLTAVAAGRKGSERLFLRADGAAWSKSHQARPLLEACAAARIEPAIGFHVLRHTWASHRVMRGMPLLAVANVLGHADTRMAERHYAHLAPSFVRDVVRATAMNLGPIESTVATIRAGAV